MKVMLDTNILISSFIFKSKNIYQLIEKLSTKHQIIISEYCIEELKEVVRRKFRANEKCIDVFLESFPFRLVKTPEKIEKRLFEIRDDEDYIILHTAIIEDVDVFITGDKDFKDVDINKPKIMTIKEFLNQY